MVKHKKSIPVASSTESAESTLEHVDINNSNRHPIQESKGHEESRKQQPEHGSGGGEELDSVADELPTTECDDYDGNEQQNAATPNTLSSKKRRAKNIQRRSRAANPKDLVPQSDADIKRQDFPRACADMTIVDICSVSRQLGYLPLNIVKVGAYNYINQNVPNPTVAVLYPLSLNKPERQDRPADQMGVRKSYNKPTKQGYTGVTEGGTEEDANDDKDEGSGVAGATKGPASSSSSSNSNSKEKAYKPYLPFPTTLWMTCPVVHARVCHLEEMGWIQRLDDRLKKNIHVNYADAADAADAAVRSRPKGYMDRANFVPGSSDAEGADIADIADSNGANSASYVMQQAKAHRAYQEYRWSLLTPEDQRYIRDNQWEDSLRYQVGIAGIKHFDSVKCLHSHYSHFLARPQDGNLVGKWVHELLAREDVQQQQHQQQQQQYKKKEMDFHSTDTPAAAPVALVSGAQLTAASPSPKPEEEEDEMSVHAHSASRYGSTREYHSSSRIPSESSNAEEKDRGGGDDTALLGDPRSGERVHVSLEQAENTPFHCDVGSCSIN